MALISNDEEQNPIAKPNPIRITAPTYKGVTVDTRYTPTNAILTTLEGSAWVVNYYQQVIDDDNGLHGQLTNREAPYQQYRLIEKLELRVTSPLTHSQNDETKEMALRGSSHVHPTLVPNVGDMFLADIGDGREGVFKVTVSERKTLFKDTAHLIEYEFIDYSTDERRADFKRKTVKTFVFVKDFNYYGQNPLIEQEQYYLIRELTIQLQSIVANYFTVFFSNEYQSLMLPGQAYPIYDHFLVNAVKAIFNTDEHPKIMYIRRLNVSDDQTMQAISLWDALVKRDKRMLLHAFEEVSTVSAYTFSRDAMMESVYHSGFQYLIYPLDNEVSVDYLLQEKQKEIFENVLRDAPSKTGRLQDLVTQELLGGLPYGSAPLVNKVLDDGCYVLSQAFYDNTLGQSKFELATRDYIEGKPLDRKLLKVFCQTYLTWGGLERFYYTPILVMMIKSVLKGD